MSGKHYKGPEVSCCIKYFIFGFNVIFWVSGRNPRPRTAEVAAAVGRPERGSRVTVGREAGWGGGGGRGPPRPSQLTACPRLVQLLGPPSGFCCRCRGASCFFNPPFFLPLTSPPPSPQLLCGGGAARHAGLGKGWIRAFVGIICTKIRTRTMQEIKAQVMRAVPLQERLHNAELCVELRYSGQRSARSGTGREAAAQPPVSPGGTARTTGSRCPVPAPGMEQAEPYGGM